MCIGNVKEMVKWVIGGCVLSGKELLGHRATRGVDTALSSDGWVVEAFWRIAWCVLCVDTEIFCRCMLVSTRQHKQMARYICLRTDYLP